MATLKLSAIRKTYDLGKLGVPVLKGVSLAIEPGEMVALMGASGSGKTTLINILGCLDQPTSGQYWLEGDEVSHLSIQTRAAIRNERIGFVFQSFNLLPRLTALENVMMPATYSTRRQTDRAVRARAVMLLERVGLGGRLHHEPARLSGGEQQRVAIARALINQVPILIADEPTGNLDSKTGEEILALFRELNEQDGITVIMVTHDAKVAAHADRTIRIADGLISDDPRSSRLPGVLDDNASPAELDEADDEVPVAPVSDRDAFRFLVRATTTALRSLRRNVLRSVLTTLGIIIGVASIIAIAEIGQGSSSAIREVLETTGVNNLLVQAGAASSNGISQGSGTKKTLTPEDTTAILNECPAVDSLAPIVYARRQVVYSGRNWNPVYLYGTTPSFLRVRRWEDLSEGEPFTERDVHEVAQVCMLGQTVATELFETESPVGREVIVNDVPLRVLGVLSRKGTNIIGVDEDDIVLAPWTTVKFRISASSSPNGAAASGGAESAEVEMAGLLSRRYPRSKTGLYVSQSATQALATPVLERFSNVDAILVRATTTDEIPTAKEQIRDLLHERHRIGPDQVDDFDVKDFTEVIRAVGQTINLVAGLLICVALISLMVGGVGIMNIMLVSVTERYREIGLRMAIGAGPRDILRQFLVEAVVLCLLGGTVGIALGRGSSYLVRVLARWPTETSPVAMVAAVSVSVTVGIVFGYYPAWKASRLNPIEALRHE